MTHTLTGRRARIQRTTRESDIVVELDLDGTGQVQIDTGVPFFDHMLTSLGTHASFDLTVQATGDVHIEAHHTVEDTAIVLGQALGEALGDKKGIRRFGDAFIPMDETLAHAAVDVSGRPYCVHVGEPESMVHFTIAGTGVPYHTVINRHVFESLASHARIALHVRTIYGRDPHHITEAEYKAVARALRQAVESDPRVSGVPSTKRHSVSPKKLVVLDYGSGNLRSAQRALERVGAVVEVTADPGAAADADGLVVPGVGAYEACMSGLRAIGGEEIIADRLQRGRPVLGVCVGMQILFTRGVEFGVESAGCGQWPGAVTRLDAPVIPHMGWNTVDAAESSTLFGGLDPQTRFYFVHSYAAQEWTGSADARLTWATHHVPFLAAVEDGPLSATQFHPEKSGDAGATLLANWVEGL